MIALREIAEETIDIDEMKTNLIEEYQTVSSQNEEEVIEYSDDESDKSDISENDDTIQVEEKLEISSQEENSLNISNNETVDEETNHQNNNTTENI